MEEKVIDNGDDECMYANKDISNLANIGELLKTTDTDQLLKSDKIESDQVEKTACFYHGRINRRQSERILNNNLKQGKAGDGLFLLRESTVCEKDFVLSMIYQDTFYHFQVNEKLPGFYHIDDGLVCQGLDSFIKLLQKNNTGIPAKLTDFCEGQPLPEYCRKLGSTNVLHRAVWEGIANVVEQILRSPLCPNVNYKNAFGSTAIHDASFCGFDGILELLIDAGACVHANDRNGHTPLHRACAGNRVSAIQVLISKGHADPQVRNPQNSWTSLHEAAYHGNVDCVRMLISDFHAPCFPRDEKNRTPLDIAKLYQKNECFEVLDSFELRPPSTNCRYWFHPEVDREGTTHIFKSNGFMDGMFLVRKSKLNPLSDVLSLCHNKYVYNYEIKGCHYRKKFVYYVDDGPYMASIEHLVEHYSRLSDGLPCLLIVSISTSGELIQTDEEEDDYIHLSDATHIVKEIPKADRPSLPPRPSRDGQHIALTPTLLPKQPHPATSTHSVSYQQQLSFQPQHNLKIIPGKDLYLGRELGQGQFGSVVKGEYYVNGKRKHKITVAIKTFITDHLNNEDDFKHEAAIMNTLNHNCIVKLIGLCESPLLLIEEFVRMGSMLDYLLDYPDKISVKKDLYLWARQIAFGMMYLETMKMVHRDLAARNILIETKKQVKISDFGLSRVVGVDIDYYKASCGGKWPVKWYAPECVNYGKFTHATDVWSFGVTLWEMFTFGEPPYGDSKGIEVIQFIEEGKRLEKPENCPEKVYKKMTRCWAFKPEDRPTFQQLHAHFESDPEYMIHKVW